MAGYNANYIGGSVLPNASQQQPGIWSIQEVHRGRAGGNWPSLAAAAVATGGDLIYQIEQGGTSYVVHQFTTVGTATFTLSATKTVEYLVVGGGGGGGSILDVINGGGGGAGGFLTGTLSDLSAGSYAVKVGSGGAPTASGQSSEFDTIIAQGGGAGGNNLNGTAAQSGGSGGGGSSGIGGTGISGQGYAGGNGPSTGTQYGTAVGGSGGGGGAGGAGVAGNAYGTSIYGTSAWKPFAVGGQGGPGLASSITGVTRYYAGGGGGGYSVVYATYAVTVEDPGDFLQSGGLGGVGGGGHAILGSYVFDGNASLPSERRTAGDGQLNTGGGGGAGGGSGGSGIVVVRYALS